MDALQASQGVIYQGSRIVGNNILKHNILGNNDSVDLDSDFTFKTNSKCSTLNMDSSVKVNETFNVNNFGDDMLHSVECDNQTYRLDLDHKLGDHFSVTGNSDSNTLAVDDVTIPHRSSRQCGSAYVNKVLM